MKLTPIFDTSSLIDLCRNDDSLDVIVKRLKPYIPSRGCPLSFVTALELFRGLSNGDPEKVDKTLKPLLLAARLSQRVVLRTPITFATWELFQVKAALRHRPNLLMEWLGKIQMPGFSDSFRSGETHLSLDRINRVFEKIEREEHLSTAAMLDRWYPDWREERRNGCALPADMREMAKRGMQFDTLRQELPAQFLSQLEIDLTPDNISKARIWCDAYFTFQVNRLRDSVIGNYKFEKNPTDFHDWLQLLYLTRPHFCLVVNDGGTFERTRQSPQRSRIMKLNQFLAAEPRTSDNCP